MSDIDEQEAEYGANIGTTKQLREIIDRVVRLETERAALASDIKVILEGAADIGFGTKALRIIIKREMEDADQTAAREAVDHEVDTLTIALLGLGAEQAGGQ